MVAIVPEMRHDAVSMPISKNVMITFFTAATPWKHRPIKLFHEIPL